jgi:FkbM family methyltransferase
MSDIVEAVEYLSRHREIAVFEILQPFEAPVMIAGAYKGDTIRALKQLDPAVIIHGFEPQPWCYEYLHNLDFILHPFALGTIAEKVTLHRLGGDYASLIDTSKDNEEPMLEVQMVEANKYLSDLSSKWSLFILNMEGYEYVLLPYMEQTGILKNVKNLLVQFHPKVITDNIPTFDGFQIRWNRYPAWIWWSR